MNYKCPLTGGYARELFLNQSGSGSKIVQGGRL